MPLPSLSPSLPVKTASRWTSALLVLAALSSLEADVISYNAAVAACEKGSRWLQSLQLLSEMQMASLLANLITYNALVTACANFLVWLQALALFQEMERQELEKNVVTYVEVLRAQGYEAITLTPCLLELLSGRSQEDLYNLGRFA
eukprot:Skav205194  [mRNA]  locus=scaffold376:21178:21905:+ [translate_table: standard]